MTRQAMRSQEQSLHGGARKKMKTYKQQARKLIKNTKAISPIFATLILIAIAVIAGVVVYMFTSGTLATMTGQGTAGQEKMAIQTVAGVGGTSNALTIYAQSLSGGSITLDTVIVKNSAGSVIATITNTTPILTSLTTVSIATGSTATTLTADTLAAGSSYTVTLVTANGGNFVSPSFIAA